MRRTHKQIKGIVDRMVDRGDLDEGHQRKVGYLISEFRSWGVFYSWDHVFQSMGKLKESEYSIAEMEIFNKEKGIIRFGKTLITIFDQIMRIVPDEEHTAWAAKIHDPVIFKPHRSHYHVVCAPWIEPEEGEVWCTYCRTWYECECEPCDCEEGLELLLCPHGECGACAGHGSEACV